MRKHIWKLDPNTSNLPVALFQKLEYVTENCFELLIFEHTSKNPSKYCILGPNGYHQWIRAEVLPLESALLAWKGPIQVYPRSDFIFIFVISLSHHPTLIPMPARALQSLA